LVPAEFLLIPPRITSVEFEHDREDPRDRDLHGTEFQQPDPKQWSFMSDSSSVVNLSMGDSNYSDIARSGSPRKLGRHRTDTMVASEAASVVEELARSSNLSAEELDREIATERMLSAVPQQLEEPATESETYSSLQESAVTSEEPITSDPDDVSTESAPTQETELLLDIAAPAPSEPAIPVDVEIEEDITEESTASPAVIDSEVAETTSKDHQEPVSKASAESGKSSEEDEQHEEVSTTETAEVTTAEDSVPVEPPAEPRTVAETSDNAEKPSAIAEEDENGVKPLEPEPLAVESHDADLSPQPTISEEAGAGAEEKEEPVHTPNEG
jgi:hypothetical protein